MISCVNIFFNNICGNSAGAMFNELDDKRLVFLKMLVMTKERKYVITQKSCGPIDM
jgi:hypothetical protein